MCRKPVMFVWNVWAQCTSHKVWWRMLCSVSVCCWIAASAADVKVQEEQTLRLLLESSMKLRFAGAVALSQKSLVCASWSLSVSVRDATPFWRCNTTLVTTSQEHSLVQSSKQYFSHCLRRVYAQVRGVCLFRASGVWLALFQQSRLQFFCSFYEGKLLGERCNV
jgi:hypothetical protein